MADFPFTSEVLFAGQYYPADSLPRAYLPVLLSLQFTEPALILVPVGVGVITWMVGTRHQLWPQLLIILCWFFTPFIAAIVFRPALYDNFRQLLFIIPPLLIFAGIALEHLFDILPGRWAQMGLGLLVLIPGIYSLIHLHPYQYVYFNMLVGGLEGAFRKYENDYWATSFKEATEFINSVAPEGSLVVASEPHHIVRNYANQALSVELYPSGAQSQLPEADYAITTTRLDKDTYIYPEERIIYQVQRDGAVFAIVRQVN